MKRFLKILVAVVSIIILFSVFNGGSAEKTAQRFVESVLDGDAKRAVSLISDEGVQNAGFTTRKLMINALDDSFESLKNAAKEQYGKNWKYKVSVIDSYTQPYEYGDGEITEVYIEINYHGKIKDGKENQTIMVKKEGRKRMVLSF